MTYFANGTDGEIYQEAYCSRCQNWKEDPADPDRGSGCPIMDLHWLHNGEEQWKPLLNMLIPEAPAPAWHAECRCFVSFNMKPDRYYVPPMPRAYRLLAEAKHELESAVEATQEVADEQLEEVQTHYEPEHVCTDECSHVAMAVWLANLGAETTARDIGDFLKTVVEAPQ